VARHIASHGVTVTSCDTVPRASRHIRPSLEGGVHVTRDQQQDGIDLIIGHHVLRAGTVQTSPRLQITRSCPDAGVQYQQRNVHPPYPLADIIESARIWSRSAKGRRQSYGAKPRSEATAVGVFARAIRDSRTSSFKTRERGSARVRGGQALVKLGIGEASYGRPRTTFPNQGGVGGNSVARPIIDLLSRYSAASSKIWAAFFPKISDLRFLAAAGLVWNDGWRASGTRRRVFPSSRCRTAAGHEALSATRAGLLR
jgi:hypothetical protein